MGVTEAILRLVGTVPDCSEELMTAVMMGQRVGRQAFTNVVNTLVNTLISHIP